MEISSSVHSGSESWGNCDRVFPHEVRVSSFPDRFPHCLESGIVSPLQLKWVRGVCVFRCNLLPALLAEWPGSFTPHCGNTGVEQTSNKSQHTKLTLKEKILPPLLPKSELTTFRSRVSCSNQQAFPALPDLGHSTHRRWRCQKTSSQHLRAFDALAMEVSKGGQPTSQGIWRLGYGGVKGVAANISGCLTPWLWRCQRGGSQHLRTFDPSAI